MKKILIFNTIKTIAISMHKALNIPLSFYILKIQYSNVTVVELKLHTLHIFTK